MARMWICARGGKLARGISSSVTSQLVIAGSRELRLWLEKNQCVLCRGSSLWAHREAYLTKTTKTAKYIFVCTSFLSLCHITLRKNCQKVKSQLLLHPSSCNDDAYIFLRLSSSHSQVTFWHCWRKMKKIFSNRKYTSSKCDCLNRWLALALSSADV